MHRSPIQSTRTKILGCLITLFIVVSCSKIQPETPTVPIQHEVHKSNLTCGIITCETQKKLSNLQENGKLSLPDLEYYKKRFSLLAERYPESDKLIGSSEFKKFTEDLNVEFFSCSGDYHECEPKNRKYGYDEMNYLFYIFIPSMVIDIYANKKDDREIEDIIQAIKRKDYITSDIKDSYIAKSDVNLRAKIEAINLGPVDKERLKTDREYREQVIFSPGNGLYDRFIADTSDITGWIGVDEEQMEHIIEIALEIFEKKLASLGLKREVWGKDLSLEKTIGALKQKTNQMSKRYSLEAKMPIDRFYRNDELSIFNPKNIGAFEAKTFGKDKGFVKDVIEIRHYTYLLFTLGKEENLFFLPNRLKRMDFENSFIATNLFEYAKNANLEPEKY